MRKWTRPEMTRNGIEAKCCELESTLCNIKCIVRDGSLIESQWIKDASIELREAFDHLLDIRDLLDSEQSARLAEYEKRYSVTAAVHDVLYPDVDSEVDNE